MSWGDRQGVKRAGGETCSYQKDIERITCHEEQRKMI